MTKDLDLASLRVQSLSLHTQKILRQIKNKKSVGLMDKEKSINSIIKKYRDHIANSEPYERDFVNYGSYGFETTLERYFFETTSFMNILFFWHFTELS